jgi:hypothetical protein
MSSPFYLTGKTQIIKYILQSNGFLNHGTIVESYPGIQFRYFVLAFQRYYRALLIDYLPILDGLDLYQDLLWFFDSRLFNQQVRKRGGEHPR